MRQHHHHRRDARPDRGFTLIELMVALAIFTVISITLLHHLTISYSATADQQSRVFAYTKAQTILSEMHSLVDANPNNPVDLDSYDDGASQSATLSISTEAGALITPDHPASGNAMGPSGWKWFRRINVRPFASVDNRGVRYVTVSLFQIDDNGREREMASLSSVLNSLTSGFPTTQIYDVYLLAVENIPGWWVFMENIVPSVEAAITDLESRNPGLELRTHWITKASYGRDENYKPYINAAQDSAQDVPFAYYYPGKMPTGLASSNYYVPSMMRGRLNQDGVEAHGYDSNTNPHPYALADFYNHAMRLPRERALHAQRLAAVRLRESQIASARAAQIPAPPELDDMSKEPTLRLLLEDMNTDPDKYKHALLINLHGELMPMPSIRNYSDAAKTAVYPGLRVVTHPEELRTHRDPAGVATEDVYLRVYAYSADPAKYFTGADPIVDHIIVDVMDVDLRGPISGTHYPMHPDGFIRAMQGGTAFGGTRNYPAVGMTHNSFPAAKTVFDTPAIATNEMRYALTFLTLPNGRKFTRIMLYNTPIRCDTSTGTPGLQGLENNARSRLYGLEYHPSPTGDLDFTRDLAAVGNGPKNSARWRIKIPESVLSSATRWYHADGTALGAAPAADVKLTVRTHILDNAVPWPEQPGQLFPTWKSPENLSETYTWWAQDRTAVPMTERSQFLGDPRHNPYKDLLHGDPDFGDGYNWFFADFDATVLADFPGIARHFDRWNSQMRQDVPRFFELLRTGLINSGAIYTTLTGYSYYYMGHGNEIGYDSANGYPSSIPTSMLPFGGASGAPATVDNITGYRRYVREGTAATDYWWGKPWLGELYPDAVATSHWRTNGNLATTAMPESFYRARDVDCLFSPRFQPYGTTAGSAQQRTQTKGCVTFMNNGTSSAHFNHHFSNSPASLAGPGFDLQSNYNFPLPNNTPCNRPFTLDTGGNLGEEWSHPPYSTTRSVATLIEEYYDRGARAGSGLVMLENTAQTNGAYVVVSGLSQSTTTGASFIAKYSLLAMLQSFFEVGATATAHRILQTPRTEIVSPNELTELPDPTMIPVQWQTNWVRWDGKKYTSTTPSGFAENESDIEYSVMFSRDNGRSWTHLQMQGGIFVDVGAPATPGVRPTIPAHLISDSGTGPEIVNWPVPSGSFPLGSYLLRVEAYRKNQSLHYSQHVTRFFIER